MFVTTKINLKFCTVNIIVGKILGTFNLRDVLVPAQIFLYPVNLSPFPKYLIGARKGKIFLIGLKNGHNRLRTRGLELNVSVILQFLVVLGPNNVFRATHQIAGTDSCPRLLGGPYRRIIDSNSPEIIPAIGQVALQSIRDIGNSQRSFVLERRREVNPL